MNNLFTTYEATDPPNLEPLPNVTYFNSNPFKNLYKPQTTDTRWFPNYTSQPSSNSDVVDLARQYIGTKYTWGGSNPSTGFDCSGFIQYLYKQQGINLPRTVKDISKVGTSISLNDVQPGDVIASKSNNSPSGRHIKLVSKVENGQVWTIDARGKKYGVVERPLTDIQDITTIRRIT